MAIAVGSRNTLFSVMLDSTSNLLWIPSENCTTGGCANSGTLGPNDSTTLSLRQDPVEINYDSWSKGSVSAVLANDNISIAGLSDFAFLDLANRVDTNVTHHVHFHPP